jgi:hypothetical protein
MYPDSLFASAPMQVRKVCCQSCGADLEVDETVRFVTCNFCGSKLEIVHDTTTTHSRLLDEIDEKTDRISEDLKVIRLQNEIERVDREWQVRREGMMTKNKDGSRSKPSVAGSIVGAFMVGVFAFIWMGATSSMASKGGPSGLPLVGVVLLVIAVFVGISGVSRAGRYEKAEREMQERRRELQEKLNGLK